MHTFSSASKYFQKKWSEKSMKNFEWLILTCISRGYPEMWWTELLTTWDIIPEYPGKAQMIGAFIELFSRKSANDCRFSEVSPSIHTLVDLMPLLSLVKPGVTLHLSWHPLELASHLSWHHLSWLSPWVGPPLELSWVGMSWHELAAGPTEKR